MKCYKKPKEKKMKPLEKFLYHASAYAVSISILFFIFGRALNINELSITFLRYFTIIAFSLVLSSSEYIFSIKKLNGLVLHMMHYAIVCSAFVVVFLTVRNSDGKYSFSPAGIFAAIVLFSIFYVMATVTVLTIKSKASKNISKKDKKQGKKINYKSRFGD